MSAGVYNIEINKRQKDNNEKNIKKMGKERN